MKSFLLFASLLYLLPFQLVLTKDDADNSTQIPDMPAGWERFASIDFDTELTDEFEPKDSKYSDKAKKGSGKNDNKEAVQLGSGFGLHMCTFRPCNCYIGSCFAYCVWNWCFEKQDRYNTRFKLPCDTTLNPWDCPDFIYPCIKYC